MTLDRPAVVADTLGSIIPLEVAVKRRAQVVVADLALRKSESPDQAKEDAGTVLSALGLNSRL
jgi:hypothetical protein